MREIMLQLDILFHQEEPPVARMSNMCWVIDKSGPMDSLNITGYGQGYWLLTNYNLTLRPCCWLQHFFMLSTTEKSSWFLADALHLLISVHGFEGTLHVTERKSSSSLSPGYKPCGLQQSPSCKIYWYNMQWEEPTESSIWLCLRSSPCSGMHAWHC